MLLHGTPTLPVPLGEMSPWLDARHLPAEAVLTGLAAQPGRRLIKTHTPLDGVPAVTGVRYLVAARHPLDAAVSLYHQINNIDRAEIQRRQGLPEQAGPVLPPLRDWLIGWIDGDGDGHSDPVSIGAVLHHLSDAWARREEKNVTLVHYADLSSDLPGEIRRIASFLGVQIADDVLPDLVEAAQFRSMRADADRLAPRGMPLKDRSAFFRSGRSGGALEVLTDDDLDRYETRAASLASADLLAWLHRPV